MIQPSIKHLLPTYIILITQLKYTNKCKMRLTCTQTKENKTNTKLKSDTYINTNSIKYTCDNNTTNENKPMLNFKMK